MRQHNQTRADTALPGQRISRTIQAVLAVGMLAGLAGCDNLIEIESPSRVLAGNLFVPANAQLLVASVQNDFECAFASYIIAGGLVGNELEVSMVNYQDNDRRTFNTTSSYYTFVGCESNGISPGVYAPLSTARWQADNLLKYLEEWTDAEVPNRMQNIGMIAAYAGYSYVLMAEAMCSAAFDIGPELQPAQIFERAAERFTRATAAAQAANDAQTLDWARVGRARTRLRLKNYAGAGQDAALVTNRGFVKIATRSPEAPHRENRVWVDNIRTEFVTIDPSYRGVSYQNVPDRRVAVVNANKTAWDGTTPLWQQTKYSSASSSIPIAKWAEARLILAESLLEAGNVAGAVAIINDLHAAAGLPAFNGGNAAEVRAQLLYERKAELFLESHHLGDVRQYDIPLTPAAGQPFKYGGVYQGQKCYPLPDREKQNNPNLQ